MILSYREAGKTLATGRGVDLWKFVVAPAHQNAVGKIRQAPALSMSKRTLNDVCSTTSMCRPALKRIPHAAHSKILRNRNVSDIRWTFFSFSPAGQSFPKLFLARDLSVFSLNRTTGRTYTTKRTYIY